MYTKRIAMERRIWFTEYNRIHIVCEHAWNDQHQNQIRIDYVKIYLPLVRRRFKALWLICYCLSTYASHSIWIKGALRCAVASFDFFRVRFNFCFNFFSFLLLIVVVVVVTLDEWWEEKQHTNIYMEITLKFMHIFRKNSPLHKNKNQTNNYSKTTNEPKSN